MLSIEEIKSQGMLLFECVSGSKAYGLDTATSDTDYKGVFVLPRSQFYGLEYTAQVSGDNNNKVYYELKHFVDLLYKNNPNLLEMLNVESEYVLYRHPLFDLLTPELFLSQLCKETFSGYAFSQIKKARGLNKKIFNPVDKEHKSILDFCYISKGKEAIPLLSWLAKNNFKQEQCGLSNIQHMKGMYALFYDTDGHWGMRGIAQSKKSTSVSLSSIPKEAEPVAYMYFNKEGHSKYCKDYKEYWQWVQERNESRYENTIAHNKNYDAKNIMHTFRLLDMAEEILGKGQLLVKRPNREELLQIKAGVFSYEELMQKAEAKIQRIDEIAKQSPLPEKPQQEKIEQILVEIRHRYYTVHRIP
ncbi:MAG: nucleotidyltransferase domain-containing protein [Spirochaetota bacterium]